MLEDRSDASACVKGVWHPATFIVAISTMGKVQRVVIGRRQVGNDERTIPRGGVEASVSVRMR